MSFVSPSHSTYLGVPLQRLRKDNQQVLQTNPLLPKALPQINEAALLKQNLKRYKTLSHLSLEEALFHLTTKGFDQNQEFFQAILTLLASNASITLYGRFVISKDLTVRQVKAEPTKSLHIRGQLKAPAFVALFKKWTALEYFPGKVEMTRYCAKFWFGRSLDVSTGIILNDDIEIREFKRVNVNDLPDVSFCTKSGALPQFALICLGVTIGKWPLKSELIDQDLVLCLPEKGQKAFLHTLVRQQVQAFFEKKQEMRFILALYQGLLNYERGQFAKLLQNELIEKMQSSENLVVPYEHGPHLKALYDQVLPLPRSLTGNCFARFEAFCIEKAKKKEVCPFALAALEGKLIEGKAVIFAADHLLPSVSPNIKVAQVCSFGLERVLFAPRSLLQTALRKKSNPLDVLRFLKFSLIHRYGQTSQLLSPANETAIDHFLAVKDHPCFASVDLSEEHFLRKGLFSQSVDEPFLAFFNSYFVSWVLKAIDQQDSALQKLFVRDLKKVKKEEIEEIAKSRLVIFNGKIWALKKNANLKAFLALYKEDKITSAALATYFKKPTDFAHVKPSDVMKILFCFLLKCYGITKQKSHTLSIGNKILWPPKNVTPTVEELIFLFCHLSADAFNTLPKTLVLPTTFSQTVCVPESYHQAPKYWEELLAFHPYEIACRQPLLPTLFHLFVFKSVMLNATDHLLNEMVARSCLKLISAFHSYLSVPDHAFRFIYGEAFSKESVFNDCSLEASSDFRLKNQELTDACLQFKENPALFDKMLQFLEEGILAKLDVNERNEALSQSKKPLIFDITTFNPLGPFCILLSQSGAKVFLTPLLENAKGVQDLFLLSTVLCHPSIYASVRAYFKAGDPALFAKMIASALFYIDNEVAHPKNGYVDFMIDADDIDDFVTKNRHAGILLEFFSQFFNKKRVLVAATGFVPNAFQERFKKAPCFRLAHLQTTKVKEALQESNWKKAETYLIESKDPLLQTTQRNRDIKDFLTIALRNSLYRMRRVNTQSNNKIFVDLCPQFEGSSHHLAVTMTDSACFSTLSELFDFIQKEGPTLCSACEYVVMRTLLWTGKAYYIKIVPLRQNGMVYDFSVKCLEIDNDHVLGTSLSALLYNENPDDETRVFIQNLQVGRYLEDVLSMSYLAPYELVLKGKKLSQVDENIAPLVFGNTTFIKMKGEKEGYVLFNNIALKPLSQFLTERRLLAPHLSDLYSKGWIVNVGSEMTLATDIANWFFFLSFSKVELQQYFHQLASANGDFWQMRPVNVQPASQEDIILALQQKGDSASLELFFNHFSFQGSSFIAALHECYQTLLEPLQKKKNELATCESLLMAWKTKKQQEGKHLNSIVFQWVENKWVNFFAYSPPITTQIQTTPKAKTKVSFKPMTVFLPFIKEALTLYAKLYRKYVPTKELAIGFVSQEKGHLAWYLDDQKMITLNLALVSMHHILIELRTLIQKDMLFEVESSYPLFLPRDKSSGLFNHELEHARRSPDTAHGDALNFEGQMVHFEAASSSYARLAHRAGLFDEFSEALETLLPQYGGLKNLNDAIDQLANLPKKDYLDHLTTLLG